MAQASLQLSSPPSSAITGLGLYAGASGAQLLFLGTTLQSNYSLTQSQARAARSCARRPGPHYCCRRYARADAPAPSDAAVAWVQMNQLLAETVYFRVSTAAFATGELQCLLQLYSYVATCNGSQVPTPSQAIASGFLRMNSTNGTGMVQIYLDSGSPPLSSTVIYAHIHGPAPPGQNAPIVVVLSIPLPIADFVFTLNQSLTQMITANLSYFNVHTVNYPGGEIRGQIQYAAAVPSGSGGSTSDNGAVAGAVVGGILGGIVLLSLIAALMYCGPKPSGGL